MFDIKKWIPDQKNCFYDIGGNVHTVNIFSGDRAIPAQLNFAPENSRDLSKVRPMFRILKFMLIFSFRVRSYGIGPYGLYIVHIRNVLRKKKDEESIGLLLQYFDICKLNF
jgi:hypothetical protein